MRRFVRANKLDPSGLEEIVYFLINTKSFAPDFYAELFGARIKPPKRFNRVSYGSKR
jgi:hypothetical protein